MAFTEAEIIDVARAIRPHLPELLGSLAPDVARELAVLIEQSSRGEAVKVKVIGLLVAHDATRRWAHSLLTVPLRERAFEDVLGDPQRIQLVRYGCPRCDRPPWFRFDLRDEIPVCPSDGIPYEVQDTS
ncbi:hypothetical protein ACH4SP_03590 [Streptomyces sp. NPDC021093]|uniref:hypothetical protein n=1 Tax=Streptomyces sp. NPDC021093 TaxID=3365112 RepID=UPI0037B079B9